MQRVFRVVNTEELKPVGPKTTNAFNRSVRRLGVLNPVLLAEVADSDGVIELAIIDGNRRVQAAKAARLPKIPTVVLKATTKQDRARLTLMCNYMRSGNFHTESAAILSLAADEDAVAGEARAIGLGPARMLQLYRKVATMPQPVRQAMDEHRIPITAATWVGAWPEGLQQELIELLGRRRYVNTTTVKDLREWYAERHPEEFAVVGRASEDIPFDEWSSTDLHVVDIPAPPTASERAPRQGDEDAAPISVERDPVPVTPREPASVPMAAAVAPAVAGADAERDPDALDGHASSRPFGDHLADTSTHAHRGEVSVSANPTPPARNALASPSGSVATPAVPPFLVSPLPDGEPLASGPLADREPAAIAIASRGSGSAPAALTEAELESRTGPDEGAERMVAFVVRLDAAMRELARQGHALGIGRAVWIDRTMRAWDGTAP